VPLSRRSAWFLVAFAAWNAYVWVTFVVNVYPQHGFDSFFVVHAVIGSFTVAMGLVVGAIGVRGVRQRRTSGPAAPTRTVEGDAQGR